jgi:hypothetical protein
MLLLAGGVVIGWLLLRMIFSAGLALGIALAVGVVALGFGVDDWINKGEEVAKKGVNTTCSEKDKATTPAQLRIQERQLARVSTALQRTDKQLERARWEKLATRKQNLESRILLLKTCMELREQGL